MTLIKMPIPVQFERQYKAPMLPEEVFATTELMNAYLTNESRYAGMKCTCLEQEGVGFILNNAETEWIPFSGNSSGAVAFTIENGDLIANVQDNSSSFDIENGDLILNI